MSSSEVDLSVKEAEFFEYRGEGAANIVLNYVGFNPVLTGKVLRIRKETQESKELKHVSEDETLNKGPQPVLCPQEMELFRDWPQVAHATSNADLAHEFADHVMQPLLGREFVDPGFPVHVSKEFLAILVERIAKHRPSWRVEQGQLALADGRAKVISDHSIFPASKEGEDSVPSICIEIKPKCGFLPTSSAISPANRAKLTVSRFQLHQRLKLSLGEVSEISQYDPLDFFSGDPDKISSAISAIFTTPQNNVRVFKDGVEVFGVVRAEKMSGASEPIEVLSLDEKLKKLEEALGDFFLACPDGHRVENLKSLVSSAFTKSTVLAKLLAAQKLDVIDVEGVIHAFQKFESSFKEGFESRQSEEPIHVEESPEQVAYHNEIARIKNLSLESCREIIQKFLIAATAKDCGLMATFRPITRGQGQEFDGSCHNIVTCGETGQSFMFKIAFVDLDLKPYKKIPKYYQLDQKIVSFYSNSVKK